MTATPPEFTEDVRKYAAEQAISEEEALAKGMTEKSKEFAEKDVRFTRKRKCHFSASLPLETITL